MRNDIGPEGQKRGTKYNSYYTLTENFRKINSDLWCMFPTRNSV